MNFILILIGAILIAIGIANEATSDNDQPSVKKAEDVETGATRIRQRSDGTIFLDKYYESPGWWAVDCFETLEEAKKVKEASDKIHNSKSFTYEILQ